MVVISFHPFKVVFVIIQKIISQFFMKLGKNPLHFGAKLDPGTDPGNLCVFVYFCQYFNQFG